MELDKKTLELVNQIIKEKMLNIQEQLDANFKEMFSRIEETHLRADQIENHVDLASNKINSQIKDGQLRNQELSNRVDQVENSIELKLNKVDERINDAHFRNDEVYAKIDQVENSIDIAFNNFKSESHKQHLNQEKSWAKSQNEFKKYAENVLTKMTNPKSKNNVQNRIKTDGLER